MGNTGNEHRDITDKLDVCEAFSMLDEQISLFV